MTEPRAFTEEELVEAGHELGIDTATMSDVYAEYQRELARPPARQRPFNSSLVLDKSGDSLRITIPPRTSTKVKATLKIALFGGVLSATVIGQLPWLAVAIAGSYAAVASYLSIRQARTTLEIRLGRDGGGVLRRFMGNGGGRAIALLPDQVHVRLAERMVRGQLGPRKITFVALDHGTDTYELLHGYTLAEQTWAVEEIERWLGR
jgi:hypothetical protein